MSSGEAALRELYRKRPRDLFVRGSFLALSALFGAAWWLGDFRMGDWLSPRRLENVNRFLGELTPYPAQGKPFDLGRVAEWAWDLLQGRGWEAVGRTLAISVAAIVMAAAAGWLLSLLAARSLMRDRPYAEGPSPGARLSWRLLRAAARLALLLLRSVPEYVAAFLLIAVIGPSPWAAVLALAAHNAGILGRLQGEVIENLPVEPLAALRSLGASRRQIAVLAVFPFSLPRFLLYFFYRWETCVREATVLGMLGIVSLGYWITDSRARNHYDELVFYVLLGAALVLLGDILSTWARAAVRRGAS